MKPRHEPSCLNETLTSLSNVKGYVCWNIVLDFIHIEFVLCVVHKGRCAIRGTHSIDNPESAPDTICLHAHAHAHTSTLK